jgi:hypothetical protein
MPTALPCSLGLHQLENRRFDGVLQCVVEKSVAVRKQALVVSE